MIYVSNIARDILCMGDIVNTQRYILLVVTGFSIECSVYYSGVNDAELFNAEPRLIVIYHILSFSEDNNEHEPSRDSGQTSPSRAETLAKRARAETLAKRARAEPKL